MNSRDRKRRIYARYRLRGKTIWLTAEERAWCDLVPIGREFGSKDYERLMILDAFSEGRIDEPEAMRQLGIDHDALVAMVENEGLSKQFASDHLPRLTDVLPPAREFEKSNPT